MALVIIFSLPMILLCILMCIGCYCMGKAKGKQEHPPPIIGISKVPPSLMVHVHAPPPTTNTQTTRTSSSSSDTRIVLVRMSNRMSDGKVLRVRCALDYSNDLGSGMIADGGFFKWSFVQGPKNSTLLECEASTRGAGSLFFSAYLRRRDDCVDNCGWMFARRKVYQLVDGKWMFLLEWPNN